MAKERQTWNVRKVVVLGGAVWAVAYYFDPRLGRTRRAQLQSRLGGVFRRSARKAAQKADYARGQAEGLRHVATPDSPPASDEALTAKVESEVLSRWSFPKGRINVNTVDGIVELRGTCDTSDQIGDLESRVRKVTGVVDVRNFLHLPNTPAPNKQDALRT